MKLLYEGVDITSKVSINQCEHETFAEKRSDRLLIGFNDGAGLWNHWKPARGERVQLIDGASDTGVMFVTSIAPENGLFTLRAMSMPLSGENVYSRSWEDVRFLQIGADIAAKHGLKFKSYHVTDQMYPYIRQERQTDFEFYHRLCQLESCAMLIYDETLIVYDEHQMEAQAAKETIKIGADGRFQYSDDSAQCFGAAEIVCGSFRGTYADKNASSGRVLQPKAAIECNSTTEAARFARGLLRAANKNARTGCFRRSLSKGIAAASVVNIETDKASVWDGKVFVTRTRHDYMTGETKVFFRIPLEGY